MISLGLTNFFWKRLGVRLHGSYRVIATAQFCGSSEKAAAGQTWMRRQDCVPIKLHLQKQVVDPTVGLVCRHPPASGRVTWSSRGPSAVRTATTWQLTPWDQSLERLRCQAGEGERPEAGEVGLEFVKASLSKRRASTFSLPQVFSAHFLSWPDLRDCSARLH